jgi:superfamily II DNA or RNA helicase
VNIVKNKQDKTDWTRLNKDLAYVELRNKFVYNIVLANLEKKFLILTWRTDHAMELYNTLNNIYKIKTAIMVRNMKEYSDSKVLVGNISKIGTGFDEANYCYDFSGLAIDCLILVASTKKVSLLKQLIGRAFRSDSPIIVDFVDNIGIIKRHFNEKRKHHYIREGGTIINFEAPDINDLDQFNFNKHEKRIIIQKKI